MFVTIAGSPDRVEAQLVPDAGYELDTFRISGFPRQPTPQLLSAAVPRGRGPARLPRDPAPPPLRCRLRRQAGTSPGRWCSRRLRCASRQQLSEADAHLGLANRMSLRVREAGLPRLPARRHGTGRASGSSGGRSRARARAIPQDEAREIFELPAEGPVLLVAGALAGARSLNETVIEAFAEVGPAILHIAGERDYASLKGRPRRDDYRLIASTERIGAAYSAAISCWRGREARSGRSRRREARDPRAVSVRNRRPSGEERGVLRPGRRGDHDPRPRSRRRSRPRPLAASRLRRGSSGWARRCCALPGRTRPRRSPRG